MLGKIKVLENNVHDLYSMCCNEFETKMTSQCYGYGQNLLEFIANMKKDIFKDVQSGWSDKTTIVYEKLSNLEYDLIELMDTLNPVEAMDPNNHNQTVSSCLICQKRNEKLGWDEKTRYDWFGNGDRFYEKLPSTSIEYLPITKSKVKHRYCYPSISVKSMSPPSSSSSSTTIWVEEYHKSPKKKYRKENKKYRIVRDRLPFSINKSKNPPLLRRKRNSHAEGRPKMVKERRRSSPEKLRTKKIEERRKTSPLMHRSKRRKTTPSKRKHSQSRKKYNTRDFSSSDDCIPRQRRRKKKRNHHREIGKSNQEEKPSEFYFVKKTKAPIDPGFDDSRSPNTKFIVSRLQRLPHSNNKNRKRRAKNVHVNDRDKVYGQLDDQTRRHGHSGMSSSESSRERKIYRSKRRSARQSVKQYPSPSHSQSSIFSNWSNINTNNPFENRRSYDSNSKRRNKNDTRKLHCYNLETNYCISNNTHKSRKKKIPRLGSKDRRQKHNLYKGKSRRTSNEGSSESKSYSIISNSSCSSCYELINLHHGFSKGINKKDRGLKKDNSDLFVEIPIYDRGIQSPHKKKLSTVNENESSSSLFSEGNLTVGPKKHKTLESIIIKGMHNPISVYQTQGKIGSNPFFNGPNRLSRAAVMTPLKKSSSISKLEKSVVQPKTSEAVIRHIDYSNNKDDGDGKNNQNLNRAESIAKKSTAKNSAASVAIKSNAELSTVRKSKPKLSKVGSKLRNLVKSVSAMKKKPENSKIDRLESLSSFKHSDPNAKVESIFYKHPSFDSSNKSKRSLVGNKQQGKGMLERPLKKPTKSTTNSIIYGDRSEPSDPKAKEESIFQQPASLSSIKPKRGLVKNIQKSRTVARPQVKNTNNQDLVNSDDIKTDVRGVYSLHYEKEKRQNFKCSQWCGDSFDIYDSNCEKLFSEESIDVSEHKSNGFKIHKKYHTSNNMQLSNEESWHVNWKQVVKDLKDV